MKVTYQTYKDLHVNQNTSYFHMAFNNVKEELKCNNNNIPLIEKYETKYDLLVIHFTI
jgi:hypothetical protein